MLGFGKGKMEIKIDKTTFSPGEVIKGTVLVSLKKPQKAKELSVTFYGEEEIRQSYDEDNTTRTRKLYEFKQHLDDEKEYNAGQDLTYNFEIKISDDLLQQGMPKKGVLGALSKVGKFMSRSRSRVYWYLFARLDIPWAVDVKKRVQVQINST